MDDSLKEIRFITARGVVYILNDPPQTWLRFINPDEPEANFPPDQSTGRLVRYEVSIGKPAVIVGERIGYPDGVKIETYTTDSPVTEIW